MGLNRSQPDERLIVGFLLAVGLACPPLHAEDDAATAYLSIWNDYQADVPAGWTPSYDSESARFTEVSFAPADRRYRLVIRWYARYATHRPSGGLLEMYGDPEVFVRQLSDWYAASSFNYDGASQLTEAAHAVSIGEKKPSN